MKVIAFRPDPEKMFYAIYDGMLQESSWIDSPNMIESIRALKYPNHLVIIENRKYRDGILATPAQRRSYALIAGALMMKFPRHKLIKPRDWEPVGNRFKTLSLVFGVLGDNELLDVAGMAKWGYENNKVSLTDFV